MPIITISILPDGAIPVDKMSDDGDGEKCPLPTQDDELNAENRDIAVDEANYREPNISSAFRSDQVCGSCSAYNQTEDMLDCIDDESGNTGYCQIWKFVCLRENTCDSWAEGGPITSDKQADYKDIL
jgi:hypothetical protein